jgi:hypothetical protein
MNLQLEDDSVDPVSVPSTGQPQAVSLILLGVALTLLLMICVRAFQIPAALKFFEDFDTALPSITVAVVRVPRMTYLLACGAIAVGLCMHAWSSRKHGPSLLINSLAAALILVAWIVIEVALLLPMYTILEPVTITR